MILHRPLRTGPLSSLFFLFSLSLSPPFSVPSQSSPLFAPVYSPVEGEVSVFVSPSQRAQGLILWRVWGRSPDINGDPIRTDSGVNNVTPLPSTGLGIGTKFFSLLPSSATLFDTLSLISNYSSTRILFYYVSLLDLSWKQVGVSTLKFSPIILKFIRRFRIYLHSFA